MGEEYRQESMLSQDGTKPESSIISRNIENEADVLFKTDGQKKVALDLVKEGTAKDLNEAYKQMREDAIANPVNDAWVKRN